MEKTTFSGSLKRTAKTNTNLLPRREAAVNPDFFLMVHPNSWSFEDGEWLPELGMQMRIPGVRNIKIVRQNGRAYIDDDMARMELMKKGWIIINDEEPRLADIIEDGLSIKSWKAQGGKAYRCAWETPVKGFRGIQWVEDTELKNMFRAAVRDVLMPKANPLVLEHFVSMKEKRVARLMDLAKTRPSVVEQLKKEQKQLKEMKASLETLF